MENKSKFEITREHLKIVAIATATAVVAFTAGRWIEKVSVAKSLLSVII